MTMISCLGVLVVRLVGAQTDTLDTVTGTLTIWHGDPQDITTVAFRQVPLLIDDNGNTLELIGIEIINVASTQVTISQNVVTIDPATLLNFGKTYTITVPAGAFQDASGSPSPGIGP